MEGVWTAMLAIYAMAAVVSMLVAVVIKGIVVALQAIEGAHARVAPPEPVHPALADMPPAIPPEHIAAIGAAVHAMMGTYRIVHIEDTRRRSAWIDSGRHAHHTSHDPAHAPASHGQHRH